DAQPNAAEGRIMQYVGVARKGAKGVVQVGFKPTRQLDAQSRNTYDYIFSRFPTDIGEELYVVDAASGTVLGHSDGLHNDF
ncbi:GGDEF domain-containing protein, partial [Klebsiella oxytoca]